MHWKDLLERNRKWSKERTENDPQFFARKAGSHAPSAMWVGCCDARVPADQLTGTDVGELFVHRNIANQVSAADASLAAGLQYAIEVLGVHDVIVCGHEGCGGVRASLSAEAPPSVEAWIAPLRLLARLHGAELSALATDAAVDRLVGLNVVEQVSTLARHPSVRAAWAAGKTLRLHGWVYDLPTGLLEARVRVEGPYDLDELGASSWVYAQAK